MLTDLIALAVLLLAVGGAAAWLVRAKRRGVTCIGCPAGGCCTHGRTGESASCGGPGGCSGCGGDCRCGQDK